MLVIRRAGQRERPPECRRLPAHTFALIKELECDIELGQGAHHNIDIVVAESAV